MSALTMERVVQLNEEGSCFLVHGNSNDALERYKEALRILKARLREDEESRRASETIVSDNDVNGNGAPICLKAFPLLPARQEGQAFVYRKLIRYEEEATCTTLLSVVIIFNMSLLYQTIDLDRGTCGLQTSCLQLYEMCLNLLEQTDPRHHRESAILRAICLNNMA